VEPRRLHEATQLAARGVPCALAVVVRTTGSVPGKVGSTMLVTADGAASGTVGGAGLEERAKRLCVDALRVGEGGVHRFDLASWKPEGLDSVCGGTVEIAIHVVRPTPTVLLIGGGHCAQALTRVLDVLDWSYALVDSRAEFARDDLFPRAQRVIHGDPAAFVGAQEDLSAFSHAYLMGHSHHEDGEALLALLARGFPGVIGAIGSRSKMRAFRERAKERGLEAAMDRVRCPIGVDVGSETPAEIAVAVAAEIVADVRKRIEKERKLTA
jgi:xanthine dehydrogenase accessory factor